MAFMVSHTTTSCQVSHEYRYSLGGGERWGGVGAMCSVGYAATAGRGKMAQRGHNQL